MYGVARDSVWLQSRLLEFQHVDLLGELPRGRLVYVAEIFRKAASSPGLVATGMNKVIRKKITKTVLAVLPIGMAVAGYLAITTAQASAPDTGVLQPINDAGLPALIAQQVAAAASEVGISPKDVFEAAPANSTGGSRATLVGYDEADKAWVAVATSYGATTFVPMAGVFSNRPLRVLSGSSNMANETPEFGISILVNGSVSNVVIERRDGSTSTLALTAWPRTPYASGNLSSSSPEGLPVTVRAFDASGHVIDEQAVTLPPADGSS